MVVEQLMTPKDFNGLPVGEFDVDLVVWDGKLMYGAVTDNWYPIKPYYLEVCACVCAARTRNLPHPPLLSTADPFARPPWQLIS